MHLKRSNLFVLLSPALVVLIGLVIFPTLYVINLSLRRYNLTNPAAGRPFIGLENYMRLLADQAFHAALGRTLVFTVGSVLVSLVLGMSIALLLQRRDIYGKGIVQTLVLIPIIFTPMVIGASFRFILDYDSGLMNELLALVGAPRIPFLAHSTWALVSVILVDVWQWTPFVALVLAAGLESLPREPYEASQIDGASLPMQFRYITVPLLRPVIAVVLLLRTMDAFREFDKIFIMTAGGPGSATETLSVFVWRAGFQNFNMGFAAAVGEVMLIIITLISIFYVKKIHRMGD